MSFYLRKALSVGPLRFNLSKSGIGVSAGIKGLRIGTGPRGNYVHMGRYGMYYRATLPSSTGAGNSTQDSAPLPNYRPQFPAENLEQIESGNVLSMGDSSSADLLRELNSKRKKVRLWPFVLTASVLAAIVTRLVDAPIWSTGLAVLVGLPAIVGSAIYDQMSKTVVLFYDLDEEVGTKFQKLHDSFDRISQCGRKWHIEAKGTTQDWKRNAGASSLVRRKAITLLKAQPSYVKTNISVPAIPVGRQVLYFFPDRLLVFDNNAVGAVGYDSLKLDTNQSQFIEGETVPPDSTVVGSTWRYVNKSGGPDRRFNNNRQIPIVLYEYLHLTSPTGLNELISISNTGISASFTHAITELAEAAAKKSSRPSRLCISSDSGAPQVVDLTLTRFTIGRADDNMIQLDDSNVSSHHAVVVVEGQLCKLCDLNSTNGTFVNGRRISEVRLENGNTIEIGSIRLRFESFA